MDRSELYQFLVRKLTDLFLVNEIMDAVDSHTEFLVNDISMFVDDGTDDEYAFMSAGMGVEEDYVCDGGFDDRFEM